MAYWLMKTEPDAFAWQDLVRQGVATWDGVRNYSARNHMRTMKVGDLALFYHSNVGKEAVGIARIVREHYQDPTTDDLRWSVVDVEPVVPLERPVTLAAIKAEHAAGGALANLCMIRENRLSVSPVTPAEWQHLLAMAATPDPDAGAAGKSSP